MKSCSEERRRSPPAGRRRAPRRRSGAPSDRCGSGEQRCARAGRNRRPPAPGSRRAGSGPRSVLMPVDRRSRGSAMPAGDGAVEETGMNSVDPLDDAEKHRVDEIDCRSMPRSSPESSACSWRRLSTFAHDLIRSDTVGATQLHRTAQRMITLLPLPALRPVALRPARAGRVRRDAGARRGAALGAARGRSCSSTRPARCRSWSRTTARRSAGVWAIAEYLDETRGFGLGERRLMPANADAARRGAPADRLVPRTSSTTR